MTIKNSYKVPLKKWRTWSVKAREVFNSVYRQMTDNPELYWHPKATKVSKVWWTTTAWNASWIAADAVDDQIPVADQLEQVA